MKKLFNVEMSTSIIVTINKEIEAETAEEAEAIAGEILYDGGYDEDFAAEEANGGYNHNFEYLMGDCVEINQPKND